MHLLLDAGAMKELSRRGGDTALTLASRYGHAEIVRLLSTADGWNVNRKSRRLS